MDLKKRVKELVAKGWTEEAACDFIESVITDNEDDDYRLVEVD
jgi:hypothetical protein